MRSETLDLCDLLVPCGWGDDGALWILDSGQMDFSPTSQPIDGGSALRVRMSNTLNFWMIGSRLSHNADTDTD